ncbi:MAG: hypothetical protein AB7G25_15275 [Sphingomonadaceae bacterium]
MESQKPSGFSGGIFSGLHTPVRFSPSVFGAFLLLALAVNYPGRLNPDSFKQLLESLGFRPLDDWHGPVVTWLWSLPGPLLGQPTGALLIQCVCFAFFAAVLPLPRERGFKSSAMLTAEVLFRLALVAIAGIVIKDALLAGMLLALIATVQLARSSAMTTTWRTVSIGLFILCLLVRPTNFLMFLMAFALIGMFLFRTVRGYVLAMGVAAILLVSMVPITAVINRDLLNARNSRAEKQLIVFDIAGISHGTRENKFLTLEEWPSGLPDPIGCYNPKLWDPFFSKNHPIWSKSPCNGYADIFNGVSDRTGGLTGWWVGQILSNPFAYARHRVAYSRKLMGTHQHIIVHEPPYSDTMNRNDDPRFYTKRYGRDTVPGDFDQLATWNNDLGLKPFAKLSSLLFAQKYGYKIALVVCLILFGWNLRKHFKRREVNLMVPLVAAVGIGNVGMLVFFGVASEGRYLVPTICCACVAALLALRPVASTK